MSDRNVFSSSTLFTSSSPTILISSGRYIRNLSHIVTHGQWRRPPPEPKGKERNWVQTISGKSWFSYFRFFGPTEPFFDKSWVLPDIEKMD